MHPHYRTTFPLHSDNKQRAEMSGGMAARRAIRGGRGVDQPEHSTPLRPNQQQHGRLEIRSVLMIKKTASRKTVSYIVSQSPLLG